LLLIGMGSLLKSISRFSHPHYVVNLLLSVVFFGLKTVSPICDHLFEDCELELVRYIADNAEVNPMIRKSPKYGPINDLHHIYSKWLGQFQLNLAELTVLLVS